MKTVRMNYPLALLLIVAILVPLTALGGPRDATVAGPIDDQPWGGEVDNSDYMTGSIASVGYDPYPEYIGFTAITNFGTPLVLIDYIRFFFFDYSLNNVSSTSVRQVNITTVRQSRTTAPTSSKTKRFSIRKGR